MSASEIAAKAAAIQAGERPPEPDQNTDPKPETPEDPTTEKSDDSEVVFIRGKSYPVETILKGMESGLRRTDYERTREENESLLSAKAELEERLDELRDEVAELRSSAPTVSESDDPVTAIQQSIASLEKRITKVDEAIQADRAEWTQSRQAQENARALQAEIESFKDQPFYDFDQMLRAMEDRGLGPGQADIAYHLIAAEKLGQVRAELRLSGRGGNASPVLPGTTVGGYGAPGADDAKPPAPEDWDEALKGALNDPTGPGR